jgi:cation diffusion facilitator family transporter
MSSSTDLHSPQPAPGQAWYDNETGIRVIWLAMLALGVTVAVEMLIVSASGSVALLADTLHNLADVLNSVPLLIAFYLARRAATRRYPYGFGRAEDIAGVFIVLSIALSAGAIFWESFQKLLHPQPLANVGWVAVASLVSFLGNETVAFLQIRIGRKIGSAALTADGLHARTDGLASLAVLLAVAGVRLGFPLADPLVGFLIGVAVLWITKDAALAIWYRLMDTVEPETLVKAESIARQHGEVKELHRLRMRWAGHRLYAEMEIRVDPHLTTAQSHAIAERLRHALFHEIPKLSDIVVHVDPWFAAGDSAHKLTAHHDQ